MYDVIIIGKGPAGISSAVYLKRANLNVLVIGKDQGALKKSHLVENYYGFDSIDGKELVEKGIQQAKHLGIEVVDDEVLSIDKDQYFKIQTSTTRYESKLVLMAMGISRKTLPIENLQKFEGRGVSYCATCDGFFYRDKKIAIIGNGNYAKEELSHLAKFSKHITLFTNGKEVEFNHEGVEVITKTILKIEGKEKVERLVLADATYDVDGIFIAMDSPSAMEFATKLGLETRNEYLVVNQEYQTNFPGIYGAGDVIGGFLQISKAVFDGAMAATNMIKALKQ